MVSPKVTTVSNRWERWEVLQGFRCGLGLHLLTFQHQLFNPSRPPVRLIRPYDKGIHSRSRLVLALRGMGPLKHVRPCWPSSNDCYFSLVLAARECRIFFALSMWTVPCSSIDWASLPLEESDRTCSRKLHYSDCNDPYSYFVWIDPIWAIKGSDKVSQRCRNWCDWLRNLYIHVGNVGNVSLELHLFYVPTPVNMTLCPVPDIFDLSFTRVYPETLPSPNRIRIDAGESHSGGRY